MIMDKTAAANRLEAKLEASAAPEAEATPASLERIVASSARLAEIREERGRKTKPRKSLADLARELEPETPASGSTPFEGLPEPDPVASAGAGSSPAPISDEEAFLRALAGETD